jgi:hypothetical protein
MPISRRAFVAAACGSGLTVFGETHAASDQRGSQRLSLEQLQKWEALAYGCDWQQATGASR